MNKATKIILLGTLLLIVFLIVKCNNDQKHEQKKVVVTTESLSFESSLQEALEKAYFEGQRDALSGDVRIEEIETGCYKWTSSPWDSGEEPIYKPCPDNK